MFCFIRLMENVPNYKEYYYMILQVWILTNVRQKLKVFKLEFHPVSLLWFRQRKLSYREIRRRRLRLKCDGTRAETSFRLSAKRTSPFKSAREPSVQYSTGSRVVLISCSNAGYTPCSEVVWRVLDTHSIRQFLLHFPFRVSTGAITFQPDSTTAYIYLKVGLQ
jgi:hypothetical protein